MIRFKPTGEAEIYFTQIDPGTSKEFELCFSLEDYIAIAVESQNLAVLRLRLFEESVRIKIKSAKAGG